MPLFCIIETDDGWTIAEFFDDTTADETAAAQGGVVIDPGPFATHEDACDALEALQSDLEEEDVSDVPAVQVMAPIRDQ